MHKHQREYQGLTIIELLLIIAIIAILAAILVPVYRNYVAHPQTSEEALSPDDAKTPADSPQTMARDRFPPADFITFV